MAQVIEKGLGEDGLIKAEIKTTAVLATELIGEFPDMCEADITRALRAIRASAEQDERIKRIYSRSLKQKKQEKTEE